MHGAQHAQRGARVSLETTGARDNQELLGQLKHILDALKALEESTL